DKDLPKGWSTGAQPGATDALWTVTDHRHHAGRRCAHAAGGGAAGVAAPGAYPANCDNWLETPALDLAAFQEVYVELWFYAKYQDPLLQEYLRDYGSVQVRQTASPSHLGSLAVKYTGDLTADPTTDQGWRLALFRVPPALRRDGTRLRFAFKS